MNTDMLSLAARLTAAGEPFAVATVVRREAPSSAQLGDTAVITRDGHLHGFIGGSCTRSTVVHQALQVLADNEARLISFRDDEPARADDIVTVPTTCHSGGSVEVYIDPVFPAPRLVLLGSSPVNQALARLGAAMGYTVQAARFADDDATSRPASRAANDDDDATGQPSSPAADDAAGRPSSPGADDATGPSAGAGGGDTAGPSAETLTGGVATPPTAISLDRLPALADRDDGVLLYALVATMGESDEDMLEAALPARPDYLGVIASRRRMEEIRATLQRRGASTEDIEAIDGPAGLDLGATRPEEIAVSILAKIVALRRASAPRRDIAAEPEVAAGARNTGPSRQRKQRRQAPETAIDPVCGMEVVPGAPKLQADHDGFTYHFCSGRCRNRFLEDPETYLAAAGIENATGDGEPA